MFVKVKPYSQFCKSWDKEAKSSLSQTQPTTKEVSGQPTILAFIKSVKLLDAHDEW